MLRALVVALIAVSMTACAPDVSNYTPIMDQDLVALHPEVTQAHLVQCRKNIAAIPRAPILGTVIDQASATSGNAWMTAIELGTATAFESAAGATIVGTLIGGKTGINSEQTVAKSRVDRCMRNHGEPTDDE